MRNIDEKLLAEAYLRVYEAALGSNKPVPLSQISPELAKIAVVSGKQDGNPQDDVVKGENPKSWSVGKLKPMQKEVIPGKALAFALGFLKDGQPDLNNMEAIVSNDGYIMDGHHRWAARTLLDPNALVNVAYVDLPGANLITALNIWTKAAGKQGKDGKGNVATFAKDMPAVLEQFITNGTDQWPKLNAEEVKVMLGKVPGAKGNFNSGKQIMIKNAALLPAVIHPDAPTRVDMPVVEGPEELKEVIGRLMRGEIDWNQPHSAAVQQHTQQQPTQQAPVAQQRVRR